MSAVEIKIFGQSFLINPPEGTVKFYEDAARKLDKLMTEEAHKMELRSDAKVAVKVAFMIFTENMMLKSELEKSAEIVEKININIEKTDI